MGSKSSGGGSGGGGGGGDKKTTTGTTKPGTSGGFKAVKGSSNLKQAVKPSTPKKSGGGGKSKTAAEIEKELDKLLAATSPPKETTAPKPPSAPTSKGPAGPPSVVAAPAPVSLVDIAKAQPVEKIPFSEILKGATASATDFVPTVTEVPTAVVGPPGVESSFPGMGVTTPSKVDVDAVMNQPMNPAQSMAMAGNTGLTGISEAQANTIIEANKQINKIFGDSRPETFESLGQEFGEVGSKYRRPADKQKYAEEVSTIAEGLAAGATPFIGPDGVERIGFVGTGLKDETGATILSKQLPGVTATAPTLGQVGGDIARAVTGYDSLKYLPSTFQGPMPVDQTRAMPYMQTTPGMAQGLAKLAIPGSVALGLIQDLYGKGKDYLFGEEEEEEFESLVPQPINIEELTTTPVAETGDVPEVIDFSGQDQGGGGGGGQPTPDTTPEETPAEETAELTDYQKLLQRYAQLAGFDPTRTESIVRRYAAQGGLMNLTRTTPPDRGPMSQGVASLFKNK